MDLKDIDKLLELRAAWDKYKAVKTQKTTQDIDAYYKVVWTYGVERPDEIATFNDRLTFQWLQENLPLRGECDLCDGYKGTPTCVDNFTAKSCILTPEKTPEELKYLTNEGTFKMGDTHYMAMLEGIRLGYRPPLKEKGDVANVIPDIKVSSGLLRLVSITKDRISFFCPEGHGYYSDYVIPLEKAPFDLYWTI
jgi:hypothetical protein